MKITILSTSSRHGSNSLKFAKYLESIIKGHEVKLFSFENIDIPMIGRGALDPANLTTFQKELVTAWEWAELVFILAPEYNWTTSGELINTLHQLGNKNFAHLFNHKVFAFAGVSSGRGGRMPAVEMTIIISKLISFLDQYSVVSPKIFESHETGKNLDEMSLPLGNETYTKGVHSFVDYTLKIAQTWFG